MKRNKTSPKTKPIGYLFWQDNVYEDISFLIAIVDSKEGPITQTINATYDVYNEQLKQKLEQEYLDKGYVMLPDNLKAMV